MAQGSGKKVIKPNPGLTKGGHGSKAGGKSIQKGKTVGILKPQKPKTKSNADKLRRKFTAGMVNQTEKLLGERAGHLELIGKGRKKGPQKDGEKTTQRGGSRKFG